jgi:hypothetical protein
LENLTDSEEIVSVQHAIGTDQYGGSTYSTLIVVREYVESGWLDDAER